MSWENASLMKLSNDVEKYEIKVTKMCQKYSFFLTVIHSVSYLFCIIKYSGDPLPALHSQNISKMLWENALLMKLSNDVEKYEIEVTKMGQNYSFFLTVCMVTAQFAM